MARGKTEERHDWNKVIEKRQTEGVTFETCGFEAYFKF